MNATTPRAYAQDSHMRIILASMHNACDYMHRTYAYLQTSYAYLHKADADINTYDHSSLYKAPHGSNVQP